MRLHKYLSRAVLPMLSMALLGTMTVSAAEEETGALQPGDVGYWAAQEKDSFVGSDFVSVAETDTMELLLSPKSGTIRWLDKETGVYKDTNMSQDENLEDISDSQKSDLRVSYYNGKYSETYSSYATWDSFSMCVDLDQLSYQVIDNGVRILYTLGDDSFTYKNFPSRISDERMQELVLQYLDDSERDNLEKNYYTQLSTGEWSRRSSKDRPLGSLQVKRLTEMFYEKGQYTEEELYADLEAAGVDQDEYPSNLKIVIPVEYYLEDNQLVVNVDTTAIETDDESPIRAFSFLPYFLTSNTDVEYDDGYMFVPDGSGAIINLDSTKVREYHFQAQWYGGDKQINATTYNSIDSKMMMPVFGMKNSDSTVLAVIENGAEIASLDAYIPGTDSSEPFCKMRLSFEIQSQQRIAADAQSTTNYSINKASSDVYDEDITIRYYWLGEEADYIDMANCYRDYLINQGELTAEEPEEEAPIYIELLGSTDKTQYFAGIPYEGKQTLTSFSEAQEILQDLTNDGVKNIKLIYDGMVGGGMNQRALTSGVKFASGLGGSSAFKSLVEYAESIGAEVFPNLLLQSAYTKKGLNGDQVAWNIVNSRAELYVFDPVTLQVDDEVDYTRYMMNPNYIAEYWADIKSSYTKNLGINTMASSDLMTFIGTNYKGTEVSISTGEEIYLAAVKDLSSDMKLMLSDPISDVYAYSTYLTDIPTTDSGMRVLDASIPFMQIVLDGYKTYSCESLNEETTDIRADMMRAIETKSALKFTFTYRDSSLLNNTMQNDLFAVDYNYWKDQIGALYEEYAAFYNLVKDATIENHELYERNDKLRIVTYSNGVKVYFNYSDLDETIDGVKVSAFDYEIME